jgi:hypothetical protein
MLRSPGWRNSRGRYFSRRARPRSGRRAPHDLDQAAIRHAWESRPHDTAHYHVIAHRCGYGDDLLAYCREHDFFHHFCAEYLDGTTSQILWALAHDIEPSSPAFEEFTVQACQRWVCAAERPIIGGVDWDEFKARAIWLLHPNVRLIAA